MAKAETKKTDDQKVVSTKSAFEGKKVKPNDEQKVTWLQDSKFHKAGSTSLVHPVQAEKLVNSGRAKLWEEGDEETVAADAKAGKKTGNKIQFEDEQI